MIIPLKSDNSIDIRLGGWSSMGTAKLKIISIGYTTSYTDPDIRFFEGAAEEVKSFAYTGRLNTGPFTKVPDGAQAVLASIFASCSTGSAKCNDHFNVLAGVDPTNSRTWVE